VQSDYDQGVIQYEERWLKAGTKKSETKFLDGEPSFKRIWRGDGSKKTETELKGGVPHGSDKRWHPDGKLHWVGGYHEGKLDGLVEDWNAEGVQVLKARYDKGVLLENLLLKKPAGEPTEE
jgi:antitoxin component YwqK of YwqJK toxin-antitoxin module